MAIQDIINELAQLSLEPSSEDIQDLKELLPVITQTKSKVMKAQRAGLDTSAEMDALDSAEKRIKDMLRVYDV